VVFRKIRFSGYNCTSKSPKLVDQSSPNFFAQRRRKRCQSNSFPIFDISIRSGDIRAQIGKGSEIGPKLASFSPPKFFWGQPPNLLRTGPMKWPQRWVAAFVVTLPAGRPPKLLNRRYTIEHASEHDAKFRGDRPRDLGDYALKKELQ